METTIKPKLSQATVFDNYTYLWDQYYINTDNLNINKVCDMFRDIGGDYAITISLGYKDKEWEDADYYSLSTMVRTMIESMIHNELNKMNIPENELSEYKQECIWSFAEGFESNLSHETYREHEFNIISNL